MIINVRGTSGSGKTTIIRKLIERYGIHKTYPYPDRPGKVEANLISYTNGDIFLLGSYENVCGGCDTVSTQDLVCELIDWYAPLGHVIFEGLMISHIYERYASRAREDIENWVFFMLDTDFEKCTSNIKKRRKAAGKDGPMPDSVYKNARRTYDSTYRIREKFTKESILWENIPWENRENHFFELLDYYTDN